MEQGAAFWHLIRARTGVRAGGASMARRVAVIGSGQVAQVLAAGFRKHGDDVTIGTREPSKLAAFGAEHGIAVRDFGGAAEWGEIVVLAVKGGAAQSALGLAGAKNLDGKIVIDSTNPIADAPPDHGVVRFFTGPNDSLMERLQAAFPSARFVTAWNSVGNAFMVNPSFPGGPPTMFICGNDAAAKREVAAILERFGWDSADMGDVQSARAIEPLCQLWCAPGMLRNEWTHAFKLLRR
jgi:predicted dinucleotide-binding enzyme